MTKSDVIAKDVSSKLSDDDFDEYLKKFNFGKREKKTKAERVILFFCL